ncbi:MAG TPA: OsmC family protein [Terriglobia bacterium]|nr:OsmC family protein [Terriglobia bacterium]
MEAKKVYKTYRYKNDLSWTAALKGTMAAAGHPAVGIGSPPEFKGSAEVWCPEELLIGAVNACLMLTFLSYAHHRHLEVGGYESHTEGTLENTDGKYRITRIAVRPVVSLRAEKDIPLAEEIMKSAKEGCFVSNSVTSTVDLAPQFTIAPSDSSTPEP